MRQTKNNPFRTLPLLVMITLILVVTAWCFRFGLIKTYLHYQFSKAHMLQSCELDSWLIYTNRSQPLILDARSRGEYTFSHLPYARSACNEESLNQVLAGIDKNYPIVTYSSLGFKACQVAQELQKKGYTNVYTLEGSIFQWVQEGRALMSGENRVATINTGMSWWSLLLHPRYRSRTTASF